MLKIILILLVIAGVAAHTFPVRTYTAPAATKSCNLPIANTIRQSWPFHQDYRYVVSAGQGDDYIKTTAAMASLANTVERFGCHDSATVKLYLIP